MARIELSVSLDHAALGAPEVRAWVDVDPHQGLSSELELPLQLVAARVWQASFQVDETRCQLFTYRIGLVAGVEAEWSLRFRQTELGCDLLVDSDRVMIPKCWLIGNCSVRRCAPDRDEQPEPRPSGGRHLVLVSAGETTPLRPRSRDPFRARS